MFLWWFFFFFFFSVHFFKKHPHINKHTLTPTLIVTVLTEGSRYLYGNCFCSHLSLNFHTLTFSLSRYVQLSAEHGFLVSKDHEYLLLHTLMLFDFFFFFFFFPVQVWTEPAPFLVRPITTKAWPRLGLVPSLVGVQRHFEINLNIPLCFILIHHVFCVSPSLVLPSQPHKLRAVEITQTSLRLSWEPGFGGDYPIIRCTVQVR